MPCELCGHAMPKDRAMLLQEVESGSTGCECYEDDRRLWAVDAFDAGVKSPEAEAYLEPIIRERIGAERCEWMLIDGTDPYDAEWNCIHGDPRWSSSLAPTFCPDCGKRIEIKEAAAFVRGKTQEG